MFPPSRKCCPFTESTNPSAHFETLVIEILAALAAAFLLGNQIPFSTQNVFLPGSPCLTISCTTVLLMTCELLYARPEIRGLVLRICVVSGELRRKYPTPRHPAPMRYV